MAHLTSSVSYLLGVILILGFASCKKTVDSSTACKLDQFEPNNIFESSYNIGQIEQDSLTIQATISHNQDMDFFRINAKEGNNWGVPGNPEEFKIRVTLTNPATDYDLYLCSETGELLNSSTNRGTQKEILDFFWEGTVGIDDSKTFVIKVIPFGNSYSCTPYVLHVEMNLVQ